MRRLVFLLVCGLTAIVLALEAVPRQQVSPLFRTSVDLVDVDVSVLDSDRLPVRGLAAEDFTVLEDGRPRPVVAFTAVELPSRERPSARWMSTIAPDVLDNDLQREGRLIAILMDRGIAPEELPASQRFAEAVIEQLRPGDMAAVVYSTFGVPQNFTSDRARLIAAIRQPRVGLPAADAGAEGMCACGACSLESVGDIAEAMAPVRQRRKMLFVVGTNIAIQSAGVCNARLKPVRERAFRAVEVGNVTVYAFDPGGLPTLSVSALDGRPGRGRAMANLARLGNLRTLPEHTGGRFMADPVRPADRVAEVFRESESYYVLGFEPAHADADGRFHKISVRVNREGVDLQARRGYYGGGRDARRASAPGDESTPGTLSPQLRSAVAGLWPASDVTLAVTAAPLASPDLSRSSVATVVRVTQAFGDGPPTVLASPLPMAPGLVHLYTGAFDRQGTALASSEQTLEVTPRRVAPRTFEYEVVSRLDLQPGRYELRSAVHDVRLGRSGSVYTYVDVPDFRLAPVTLSGLMMSVTPGAAVAPLAPLDGLAPVVPTTQRAFTSTDEVRAFVRLYQGITRAIMPGYVVAEILDGRDTSVYRQETRLVGGQYGASRAVDFTVDVPVARLPPGPYVLGVEARHGNDTARRDVRFTVR